MCFFQYPVIFLILISFIFSTEIACSTGIFPVEHNSFFFCLLQRFRAESKLSDHLNYSFIPPHRLCQIMQLQLVAKNNFASNKMLPQGGSRVYNICIVQSVRKEKRFPTWKSCAGFQEGIKIKIGTMKAYLNCPNVG